MKKSIRTPLARALNRAFSVALKQDDAGFEPSRRHFFKQSAVLTAAATLPKWAPELAKPRIAIVGAGIAGLSAAWALKKAGVKAKIYEASTRTGGRMFTVKNVMGPGLTTDFGGEFVDSIHTEIIGLCKEFGLDFYDTAAESERNLKGLTFFFDNRHYSETDAVKAIMPYAKRLQQDIDRIPDDLSRLNAASVSDLDQLSVTAYLDAIECKGWIRTALEMAVMTEYGMEPSEQSAINLLFTMAVPGEGSETFDVFAESDERYKIKGGSQALTNKMEEKLRSQIKFGHQLTAITQTSGGCRLEFSNGRKVNADAVILTLPFTMLRLLNVEKAGFSAEKTKAIQELGYGSSAKLMMRMSKPVWREQGFAGSMYSHDDLQCGWENSRMQTSADGSAGYTIFEGGKGALDMNQTSPEQMAQAVIPKLNGIFPGIQASFSGNAYMMHWPSSPFAKAGYSCYKVGQFSSIAGLEVLPQGRVFFAGEHCSAAFQGYMNGAAETGRQAAADALVLISKG